MSSRNDSDTRLVYSTATGQICPGCGKPKDACACKAGAGASANAKAGDGVVRIERSTKGRKGKGVCIVRGLPADRLGELARMLKQRLGAGGAVKDGTVEIQGDCRDKLAEVLRGQGFKVKLAGG